MAYRPGEQKYHTRLGWWVMTHDRGGPAVIGAGAAVVLSADLLYAASHWSGSFPRAFLISLAALAAVALISLALRFIRPIGAGRGAVRRNQRGVNLVLVVVLVAFIEVNNGIGGNDAGGILGAVAGIAGGFAVSMAVWLARKRV
jgi:hypothetical protein